MREVFYALLEEIDGLTYLLDHERGGKALVIASRAEQMRDFIQFVKPVNKTASSFTGLIVVVSAILLWLSLPRDLPELTPRIMMVFVVVIAVIAIILGLLTGSPLGRNLVQKLNCFVFSEELDYEEVTWKDLRRITKETWAIIPSKWSLVLGTLWSGLCFNLLSNDAALERLVEDRSTDYIWIEALTFLLGSISVAIIIIPMQYRFRIITLIARALTTMFLVLLIAVLLGLTWGIAPWSTPQPWIGWLLWSQIFTKAGELLLFLSVPLYLRFKFTANKVRLDKHKKNKETSTPHCIDCLYCKYIARSSSQNPSKEARKLPLVLE